MANMSLRTMPCAAPARAAVRAPSSSSAFMGFTMPQQRLRLAAPRPARQVTRMGLFGLGAPELAVIAGVVALIYGPSKLPELGKGLGKTMKSFQTAAKEFEKELKEEMKDDEKDGAKKDSA